MIEAAGVLCLIVGWRARAAAFVMFLYLGLVSVLLHNLWAAQGMTASGMQTQFLKNIGIMGGLLMIVAFGPGKWSVEKYSSKTELSQALSLLRKEFNPELSAPLRMCLAATVLHRLASSACSGARLRTIGCGVSAFSISHKMWL